MNARINLILTGLLLLFCLGCQRQIEHKNQQLVETAFENWKHGKGTVFDLLDEKMTWIVAGSSPVSGTYRTKKELLEVVNRINSKLSGPIVPTVENIIAGDSMVVAIWHGKASTKDGGTYCNTYSWHMTFHNGKIIRVTALLDTYRLAELLQLDTEQILK